MSDSKPIKTAKPKSSKKTVEAEVLDSPAPAMVPEIQEHGTNQVEVIDQSAQDEDSETQRGLELLHKSHVELSLVGGVSTDQLRQALTVQTEQRALIKAFIQHHLVEGTDYGQIHVVKDCPDEKRSRGSCSKSYHYSKRVLFKPGQEKIFSLFSITDTLERDSEAYEMLGQQQGLVAYKCTLYRSGSEKPVGHGRGAASVGEQGRNVNSTIKIAEKRARMDACLSLGFSEYFAQDLDDPDYKQQAQQANERAAAEASARDKDDLGLWKRDIALPIDDTERTKLFAMIKSSGYPRPDSMLSLLRANGIADPKNMTSGQARDFMRKLRDGKYEPVSVRADVAHDVIVDVPDGPITDFPPLDDYDLQAFADPEQQAAMAPPTPTIPEPELVIDEDFKANVAEQFRTLGLNARGEMWFKRRVLGRPWGKWEKFTDKEWRVAFNAIEEILEERLQVPEEFIAGYEGNAPEHDDFGAVDSIFPGAQRQ